MLVESSRNRLSPRLRLLAGLGHATLRACLERAEDKPSARMSPSAHSRQGGLREAGPAGSLSRSLVRYRCLPGAPARTPLSRPSLCGAAAGAEVRDQTHLVLPSARRSVLLPRNIPRARRYGMKQCNSGRPSASPQWPLIIDKYACFERRPRVVDPVKKQDLLGRIVLPVLELE
jgi:hypothetical protein